MDMKKILQAMGDVSSKPATNTDDMKKFVSIIQEGATPHKVALPVQMAMQHYKQPVAKAPVRESSIGKFFKQVEDELIQERTDRKSVINQYASNIAARVMMRESNIAELSNDKLSRYKKAAGIQASDADKAGDFEKGNKRFKGIVKATNKQFDNDTRDHHDHDDKKETFNPNISPNPGFKPGAGPGIQSAVAEEHNAPDTVTVDIPLLIRLFEYAREDAKTDMDLHNVTERLIGMSEDGRTLTMADYDDICPPAEHGMAESAPPGAKAERMVKHIKAGYKKDGKLTDKEKSIAYATAWKSHNKK